MLSQTNIIGAMLNPTGSCVEINGSGSVRLASATAITVYYDNRTAIRQPHLS